MIDERKINVSVTKELKEGTRQRKKVAKYKCKLTKEQDIHS